MVVAILLGGTVAANTDKEQILKEGASSSSVAASLDTSVVVVIGDNLHLVDIIVTLVDQLGTVNIVIAGYLG